MNVRFFTVIFFILFWDQDSVFDQEKKWVPCGEHKRKGEIRFGVVVKKDIAMQENGVLGGMEGKFEG